jgi:hypothetical protein
MAGRLGEALNEVERRAILPLTPTFEQNEGAKPILAAGRQETKKSFTAQNAERGGR